MSFTYMHLSTFIKSSCLAIFCSLLWACEKEQSTGEIHPQIQNAYQNKEEAQAAVDVLYYLGYPSISLEADANEGLPLAWSVYLSGLIESEASEGYYPNLHQGKVSSPKVEELSKKLYTSYFDAIEQADTIIARINDSPSVNAQDRERLQGEAKFFRALNRFSLLRTFGAHPTARTSPTSETEATLYSLVVKDLQDAIARLPHKTFIENKSRVSAFIARALLAEVYMQMSGLPLRENKWAEATAILRPILASGKYQLTGHGSSEDLSAYNKLRQNPMAPEYLHTWQVKEGRSRAIFSFPSKAKGWSNVQTTVAFNAYQPSKLLQSLYAEEDIRAKDRQFFHSFFKVQEGNKTIFEVFNPAPYFWLTGEGEHLSAPRVNQLGVYRYSEILLMFAEALCQSEATVREEAVDALLDVQLRAMPHLNREEAKAELMALGIDAFLQKVWLERFRELVLEMKMGYDIARTGFYPSKVRGSAEIVFIPLSEAHSPSGGSLPRNLRLPLPLSSTP